MNEKVTVVLADEDWDFRQTLKMELESSGKIKVVSDVGDGVALVDTVREFQPDVVITEYVLSELDGVSAIRAVHNMRTAFQPLCCILSGFVSFLSMSEAQAAGVDTYLCKPVNCAALIEKIFEMIRQKEKATLHKSTQTNSVLQLEVLVTERLNDIGVPIHVNGYQYLRDAIILAVEDAEMSSSITKLLYPTVSKMNKTTESRVERAIRHAIARTWEKGDQAVLESYFGSAAFGTKGRPTNSNFIAMLADSIRLKLKTG